MDWYIIFILVFLVFTAFSVVGLSNDLTKKHKELTSVLDEIKATLRRHDALLLKASCEKITPPPENDKSDEDEMPDEPPDPLD